MSETPESTQLEVPQREVLLAANLRKWRERRGLSLSALARNAEISKSTVSELERGEGNPSLDTLWSIAKTLRIPIDFLFADAQAIGALEVRRLADAPAVSHVEGNFITHLMSGWMGQGEVELSVVTLATGGRLTSKGNTNGVIERVVCTEGVVEIGSGGRSDVLTAGDFMTFPADKPHFYRTINGAARIIVVSQYPPSP